MRGLLKPSHHSSLIFRHRKDSDVKVSNYTIYGPIVACVSGREGEHIRPQRRVVSMHSSVRLRGSLRQSDTVFCGAIERRAPREFLDKKGMRAGLTI